MIQHPAYKDLMHAAQAIDLVADVKDVPEAARNLVANARAHVRSAEVILLERDGLSRRLAMICLMIQESTSYEPSKVNGSLIETVQIIDEPMFTWAVRELHELPAKYR
ncbi:MAG: hypothetical protein ABW154_14165 [Dyella sp.]